MIEDLIRKNRSCRRFYQNKPPSQEQLKDLVNLGRLSASAANLQPLKYVISVNPDLNEAIFECLGWAGYLKAWPGPKKGERPSAYIVVLGDGEIAKDCGCDHGIAAQSILLGAREMGLAGCMIGSIKRKRLAAALALASRFTILLVLAIGKPREDVMIENVGADGDIRYWRDKKGIHHVPKRNLGDIILHCHE
jgi:nitroreductase